jgi:sodium transport system permease protein
MAAQIFAITRKELRDAFRDRRSLASGLLYGIWGPLVMALAVMAIARDRSSDGPIMVPTEGRQHAPSLVAFVAQREVSMVEAGRDVRARIRARDLPVAVLVDDNFAADFMASRPATLTVLYDGAWAASRTRAERIKAAIREYERHVGASRLVLRGVTPSIVSAIDLEENDLSTPGSRAAAVVGTLPIFILLAAFIGGLSVAADSTAGERERGSLESLLLYPVRRSVLATGKWLAAALLGVATMSVTVVVASAVLRHHRIQAIDLPVGLALNEALLVWSVMLPLAFFAPAVQMLIGLFSRTFKEANTHLSLVMFVPMLPGFLFAFGTLQPQPWMRWTPILGHQLAISAIVRGEAFPITNTAPLAAVSAAGTTAAIMLTARLLDREAVVRRTGS